MHRTSTYDDFLKLAKTYNIDITNIHIDLFDIIPKLCSKICGRCIRNDEFGVVSHYIFFYKCHKQKLSQITF